MLWLCILLQRNTQTCYLRSVLHNRTFSFSFHCRYWMLDVSKVYGSGSNAWDTAVHDASEEYKHRMVNITLLDMSFINFIIVKTPVDFYLCLLQSTTSAVTTVTHTSPWLWIWWDMKTAPRGTWWTSACWLWSTENMSGKEKLSLVFVNKTYIVWCGAEN